MIDNHGRIIKVAVVGAGTVGGGTLSVLAKNADVISQRAMPVQVAWLAEKNEEKGRATLAELGLTDTKLTGRWQDIIEDPDVDVVVELIGGTGLSFDILHAALAAGKSAVTANKDLIALRGGELLELAEEKHTDLFFEAAVGGGIPIIQSVKESLAANHFSEILGIVNGTTNYILTKMSETGMDFADALAQAQQLGYAEADPTSDVEGYDAARKMAILASLAFNSRVTFDMVDCEGITHITSHDITYGKELGYTIKMLGVARSDGERLDVRVHPAMIREAHPLAAVRDSYNAVFVDGDAIEHAMFFGRGAGSLPTASAVVGDIISAGRNIVHNCKSRWGCTCYRHLPMVPPADTVSKYYVRMQVKDEVGVFAAIAESLTKAGVSMDAVVQKRQLEDGGAEIVLITHQVKHSALLHAVALLNSLDCISNVSDYIRVLDDLG